MMSAEVQPLAISIMVLFYLSRLWSSHTHTLIFLSFSGLIFWCFPIFSATVAMVIGYIYIFFNIHTVLPQLLFCLLFVTGWFSLQGMRLLFCLRVLLWGAVAAACLLTARGGCYRSADGTHNSITSACSSASCLTLFHSSRLFPH